MQSSMNKALGLVQGSQPIRENYFPFLSQVKVWEFEKNASNHQIREF